MQMSTLLFFNKFLKQRPPSIVRYSPLPSTPKKVAVSEAEVNVRCDTAMKFIGRWNHTGPWILRTAGEAKKFYADDAVDIRSFVSKRIRIGRQVDMFLLSADSFVHGEAIPVSEAGRCDTICLEMKGRPDDIRCKAEDLRWPPSSASLLTPGGMIMLWRINPTDWITGSEVSKFMASKSFGARSKSFCPIPGASKGVVFLDMCQDDKYNLNDFVRPPAQERQEERLEAVFRQHTPRKEPRIKENDGYGEIRFPNDVVRCPASEQEPDQNRDCP
jgi:hypothetical protein